MTVNKYCMVCNKLVSLDAYDETSPCPECGKILSKQIKKEDSQNTESAEQPDISSPLQMPEQLFKPSNSFNWMRSTGVIIKIAITFLALGLIVYNLMLVPKSGEMSFTPLPNKLSEKATIDLVEFNCIFKKNNIPGTKKKYEKIAQFTGKIELLTKRRLHFQVFVEIINKSGEVIASKEDLIWEDGRFRINIFPDMSIRRHAHICRISKFETIARDEVKFTSSNGTDASMIMF